MPTVCMIQIQGCLPLVAKYYVELYQAFAKTDIIVQTDRTVRLSRPLWATFVLSYFYNKKRINIVEPFEFAAHKLKAAKTFPLNLAIVECRCLIESQSCVHTDRIYQY